MEAKHTMVGYGSCWMCNWNGSVSGNNIAEVGAAIKELHDQNPNPIFLCYPEKTRHSVLTIIMQRGSETEIIRGDAKKDPITHRYSFEPIATKKPKTSNPSESRSI